ncbi:MAG: YhcN/YlaJ family sporulation lipoprotein [Anaerotignum sp.]|nr:YhcN/YlaJ family sporulation lipoprotein [Anaerotignum sp.]
MKVLAVWILLLLLCGCGAEMTDEAQQKIHFVKAEEEVGDRTPEERALLLKNRLTQAEGVIGTAVVVEGHTAIVGLRLAENMEQKEADAVRKEVDALLRSADVEIENTSITVNSYLVGLIEEMERKRAG